MLGSVIDVNLLILALEMFDVAGVPLGVSCLDMPFWFFLSMASSIPFFRAASKCFTRSSTASVFLVRATSRSMTLFSAASRSSSALVLLHVKLRTASSLGLSEFSVSVRFVSSCFFALSC